MFSKLIKILFGGKSLNIAVGATTTPTNVDSSIPEVWAKMVLRDTLRDGFWSGLVGGEGSGLPIIQKSELLNNPGDTIHIQVTNPLTGAGISGDVADLVGSEEALATTSKKVVPLLYRHAVRFNRRANKKSIIGLREEAQMRLAEWGAEKMDDVRFANFVSQAVMNGETYTSNFRVVNGGTVGAADVASTDTLSVEAIQQVRLDLYNNRAKPVRIGGKSFFAGVVHPNAVYALKRSDEYSDWVREAEVRGKDNPFFAGALAVIDGVVLFEHSNVTTAADGSGGATVARNVFFGAEAFVEGVDENPHWDEDTFEYGRDIGIAYTFAFQPRRALEKNSLLLYSAATAV